MRASFLLALAKSFVYEYNYLGNLTAVKEYSYTPNTLSGTPVTNTFVYTDDKLTSFGGSSIAYNAMGCPTTYDGMSATWAQGKLSRLTSGTPTGGTDVHSFGYNAFGQRTSKTYSFAEGSNPIYGGKLISSDKRFYYDHSGRLIAENTTRTYYGTDDEQEKIVFLYDGNTVIGMQHTVGGVTSSYYFHRDPLGNVIGIYNPSGALVARYSYDAWGNCTISGDTTNITVAQANPIRYRGYYYDEETSLYYLQSRFYNPTIGRFINADALVSTGQGLLGNNMFAYCNNTPVFYVDESGCIPRAVIDKIVHDAVLADICDNQANLSWTGTCIYYNGDNFWGGWGFCDLYNTQTGEVWELKKASSSYSCRTSTALRQLERYTNGRLKNNKDLELHMPYKTTISKGIFSFTKDGYIYNVSYWSENNGILRYTYERRKTEERKAIEAVASIIAVGVLVFFAPYLAPAII